MFVWFLIQFVVLSILVYILKSGISGQRRNASHLR